jgi:TetR/AcrR family transcriptional repressor of nem operon
MSRPREFNYDKILDRALQVFWAQGYKRTCMDDLVRKLKVNRGSIYNTFGNKQKFFRKALEYYLKNQVPPLFATLEADIVVNERVKGFLMQMVALGGKKNHYRGCFVFNSYAELNRLEPEIAEICLQTTQRIEKALIATLRAGQLRQELRSDIPAEALATIILSSANGFMAKARAKADPEGLEAAVNAVVQMLAPQLS